MIDTAIPRPANLNKGLLITAAIAVLSLLVGIFSKSAMQEMMLKQGVPADMVAQSGGSTFAVIGFSLVITGTVLFFIAKGYKVARVIWTVLGVLGMLSGLMGISLLFQVSTVLGLLSLLSNVGYIVGIVFMWLGDSSAWFKQMKRMRMGL